MDNTSWIIETENEDIRISASYDEVRMFARNWPGSTITRA